MAKKKKKKKEPTPIADPRLTEGQWYWCVNCGHHGDFEKVRKRGIKCEVCEYDDITFFELEEINNPIYDNIWLERFVTKKKMLEQPVPKDHLEIRKTVKDSKALLDKLDKKYGKIDKPKTLAEKLAEIRKL